MQTKLKIYGVGFPPFSTGNCQQILMPIKQGNIFRTINGDAVIPNARQSKKYKTKILGKDTNPPCFEGVSFGSLIKIECIQKVWMEIDGNSGDVLTFEKIPVEGSVIAIDTEKNLYEVERISEKEFSVKNRPAATSIFIGYSPYLEMSLIDLKIDKEEWGGEYKWELEAEEI
jgi:hypothetical protein